MAKSWTAGHWWLTKPNRCLIVRGEPAVLTEAAEAVSAAAVSAEEGTTKLNKKRPVRPLFIFRRLLYDSGSSVSGKARP